MKERVQLGLGLIGIGRPWGYKASTVPSVDLVMDLLETALDVGIRFFDTAPSYGTSEQRLGDFLHALEPIRLQELTIATKFGEHWNAEQSSTHVGHSYDFLCRSLEHSLKCLPKIDILQIHKATSCTLLDPNVRKALEYARSVGVQTFGASVSDLEAAITAIEDDAFSFIQLPFNRVRPALEPAFLTARLHDKQLVINRPFAEGKLVSDDTEVLGAVRVESFRFILQQPFTGVILTGTKSSTHLRENASAFNTALLEGNPR